MGRNTTTTESNTVVTNEVETVSANEVYVETASEPLNLDVKVNVRSIADWDTGFARRGSDGAGDVIIAPHGTVRLSRNEIFAQVQNNNVLFAGTDGRGSHATLFIEDAPTRRELNFESDDTKQLAFPNLKVKELFAIKSQSEFEKQFKDVIYTRAEKFAILNAMKEAKINDYSKIRFVEIYTGLKFM